MPEPTQAIGSWALLSHFGMWLRVFTSKFGGTMLPSWKVQEIGGPAHGSTQPGALHELTGSRAHAKLSFMHGP